MVRAGAATTLGRLAGPPGPDSEIADAPDDAARRIENWVVSNLEGRDCSPGRADWNDLFEGSFLLRKPETRPKPRPGRTPAPGGWARFRVSGKRGITIVRLIDRDLVKESDIRELSEDLGDLIAAGHHRLVLNFEAVDRLSSQVAGALVEAQRRCAAADGGLLRVCKLQPGTVALFSITGLDRRIAAYPEEAEALEAPWPEPTRPRPLPVTILSALKRPAGDPAPEGGVATASVPAPAPPAQAPAPASAPSPEEPPDGAGVWLIAQAGRSGSRSIAVRVPRFVIGRDAGCHLRPGSPAVSRFHAAILQRDGQVFVRDLGSTNGTLLNGRLLRDWEAPARDGDQIQVGPLPLTLRIGSHRDEAPDPESFIADWLRDGDADDESPSPDGTMLMSELPPRGEGEGEPGGTRRLHHEVIEDVLVVTPLVSRLDDPTSLDPLRAGLHALFERPLPRRVVVNLQHVAHLSSQAIGLLVAHCLRLERAGGALRVCQAHARVMAALDQVRLPMLMEFHPTLDEAVLDAWPNGPDRESSPDAAGTSAG
jgi:anti-anti-sigma factor